MKRTAEKTLSIISVVLMVIGLLMSFGFKSFLTYMNTDPLVQEEIELALLSDPTFTPADVDMILSIFTFMSGIMWVVIIGLLLALVLTIVGIVSIWNSANPKLAGIMFIIAGLLAGFLSLPSILLYIAGILCFTRKPQKHDDVQFGEEQYDGTMRPL